MNTTIFNSEGNAANIYDLADKVLAIRKEMQAKDIYNLPELKEALNMSEIEDDGYDSLRTLALRVLMIDSMTND